MKSTYRASKQGKIHQDTLKGCQNRHPAGVCTHTGIKAICTQLHYVRRHWTLHTQCGVDLLRGWSFGFLFLFNAAPPEHGPGMQLVVCSTILVCLKELAQIHVLCQWERSTPTPPWWDQWIVWLLFIQIFFTFFCVVLLVLLVFRSRLLLLLRAANERRGKIP